MSPPFSTVALPASPLAGISRLTRGGLKVLLIWQSRRRMRRSLSRLAAHQLCDIGLDATTARREAAKPFWRG